MSDALRSVAQKTGESILFTPESVEGLRAPAISGDMSAQQAERIAVLPPDEGVQVRGQRHCVDCRRSAKLEVLSEDCSAECEMQVLSRAER